MLSQIEYLYVRDLLINYYNHDYRNYVCITNNPINVSNNSYYDVYCYVSKDKINFNNDKFTISNGYKLSIDSNNYSSNNVIDKLVVDNVNNFSLSYNKKEFVYSSLENYPDLLGDYRTSLNNHVDLNTFMAIPCLLMLLFVFNFVRFCFRKR